MSEGTFRSGAMAALRGEGVFCQRFEDMFAAGIPDAFIGTGNEGLWLEFKYKVMPKKPATPINCDNLTSQQQNFLLLTWKRPLLTGVIIGTDKGWVVVPAPYMKDRIFMRPATELVLTNGRVTMAKILEYFK